MNKYIISAIILSALFFTTGCITSWTYSSGGLLKTQYNALTCKIPDKWYTRQVHKTTLLTRNGLSLESITIYQVKWDDSLSNGHTVPPNILLHQIPEIILGEYSAKGQIFNLLITDNIITNLDSFPVARSSYRFTSPNSLTMSGIMYCIPFQNQIAVLCYEAESSHYYPKSIEDFSAMVNSINIKDKKYLALPGIRIPN
ncbi:MAG TPA: hypothetical protein VHO70_19650 [Chitinispirillaceae bacterium]|nr:hypothetical protein [Chitinispirillaceae bacterium]